MGCWRLVKVVSCAAAIGSLLYSSVGICYCQDSIESRLFEPFIARDVGMQGTSRLMIGPVGSVWDKMVSDAMVTIKSEAKSDLRLRREPLYNSKYSKDLLKKTDDLGFPIFNSESVRLLEKVKVPLYYIEDLLKVKTKEGRLRGYQVYRYYRLGLTRKEIEMFEDTIKPNAVIIYPFEDKNQKSGEVGAFDSDSAIELFRRLKVSYDVWVKIAYCKQQVFEALDYVPDISLCMISGHGDKESLTLSTIHPQTGKKGYSKGVIDMKTVELRAHLKNLLPDALIFLCSCSNGKGGLDEKNLANAVYYLTENHQVLSAKDNFSLDSVYLESVIPLRVTIYRKGLDITYIRGSKKLGLGK